MNSEFKTERLRLSKTDISLSFLIFNYLFIIVLKGTNHTMIIAKSMQDIFNFHLRISLLFKNLTL